MGVWVGVGVKVKPGLKDCHAKSNKDLKDIPIKMYAYQLRVIESLITPYPIQLSCNLFEICIHLTWEILAFSAVNDRLIFGVLKWILLTQFNE